MNQLEFPTGNAALTRATEEQDVVNVVLLEEEAQELYEGSSSGDSEVNILLGQEDDDFFQYLNHGNSDHEMLQDYLDNQRAMNASLLSNNNVEAGLSAGSPTANNNYPNNIATTITGIERLAFNNYEDNYDSEDTSEYASEDDMDVTPHYMKVRGVDSQGIDWTNIAASREEIRKARKQNYKDYRNCPSLPLKIPEEELLKHDYRYAFFTFVSSRMSEKCAFLHFQLRHLISAPSKVQVFYTNLSTVKWWNPISRKSEQILDAQSIQNVRPVRISTMAGTKECVLIGGFQGEVLVKPLYQDAVHLCQLSADEIINHIGVSSFANAGFEDKATISSNDNTIKILDLRKLAIEHTIKLSYPVNCTAHSPDYRLICAVGDTLDASLLDLRSGNEQCKLSGHQDYSFSCSWSPNGKWIATGSQDKTTRIYDVRNLSKTFCTIPSAMASPRNICFSNSGKYLAIAESADFVHIIQVRGRDGYSCPPFQRCQTLDFLSDVGGIAFTPQSDSLFIGCSDDTYGCIMEYHCMEDKPQWPLL